MFQASITCSRVASPPTAIYAAGLCNITGSHTGRSDKLSASDSHVASGQVEADYVVEVSLYRNPKSPVRGRMRNSVSITSSFYDFIKDKLREVRPKRANLA
ncbi:ATP-dependent 6-phosphofructokinase [Lachancea thermotolerans]